MNQFTRIMIFLFVVTSAASALPLRYGFVLSDEATVYADSSLDAEVLETLQMTDYRYVAGEAVDDEYNFNFNGWAKILTADSTWGWIDYQNLLISSMLSVFVAKDQPLYDQYGPGAVPIDSVYLDMQIQIYDGLVINNEYWFKVKYYNKMYWYKSKDSVQNYNFWGHMFAACEYLLYGHSSSAREGFLEHPDIRYWYDEAEQFALQLKSMVDPYAGVFILPINETESCWVEYGAGALLNYQLARIYKTEERWQDAINILEESVLKYPHQQIVYYKAGPSACLDMARIYRDKLDDEEKALEKCHFVIQEYHQCKMQGREGYYYADVAAADYIYDLIYMKSPEYIQEQINQIARETFNPSVRMIARKLAVLKYAMEGKLRSVGNVAYNAVLDYPDERIHLYIKDQRNISSEVVELMFSIYQDSLMYDECIYWADKIIKEASHYPVAGFCAFKKAELLDYFNPDIKYVKDLYKAAVDSFPEFWFTSMVSDVGYNIYMPNLRYNVLNEYVDVNVTATVLLDSTLVYQIPYDSTTVMGVFSKDDVVTRLSTDLQMIDYHDHIYVRNQEHAKILLPDSTVGWVLSRNLFVENLEYSMTDRNAKTWRMSKGDSENNLYFSGPDIIDPVISGNVFNQSFSDIRFYDMNDDGVLDFVFQGVNDTVITIINGTTHKSISTIRSNVRESFPVVANERIIYKRAEYNRNTGEYDYNLKCSGIYERKEPWELECLELGAPVVKDSSIYYISADSSIACANTSNGTILWRFENSGDTPVALAVNNKALVISNKRSIQAINPKTGEKIWSKNTSESLDEQIPVLDNDNLYCMIDKKTFAAIDLENGELEWTSSNGNSSYFNFQPIVTPDYIVYMQYKDAYIVLDKYTGKRIYSNLFDKIVDSYCVGGNTIYVQFKSKNDFYDPNFEPNLYAFNLTTGKEQWRRYFSNDAHIVYQAGKLFISGESGVVIVEDGETLKAPADKGFTLYPNYPNPFNMRTVIQYVLYKDSQVNVDVFNILGQKVASIVDEKQLKGVYQASWNGRTETGQPVSSGVYLCRINVGGEVETRTMMLLK